MDFPEEDLDWMPSEKLDGFLNDVENDARQLLASRKEGQILRHGVQLVIAGATNVGKSSLMNAILGRDRAIVTHIPGTTRDTLEELAHIRGIPIRLTDTAGIREAGDLVEKFGIERSLASLENAHVILWVVDASQDYQQQGWQPNGNMQAPVIVVANKSDLVRPDAPAPSETPALVHTCALTGEGLDNLYDAIERMVWENPHRQEAEVAVSARHAALLDEALQQLPDARERARLEEWELAAVALRAAVTAIGEITGRTALPDILDSIFARFCIGK